MECSITMESAAMLLVKAGFAVYGIDYEGHGKSGGLQGYVHNFDNLVEDCCKHFTGMCEREDNKGKMRYLLGESMGGAMALLLHRKKPDFWHGAILVAPMCKIADEMRPHPLMMSVLNMVTKLAPQWKLNQNQDIVDVAFKEPQVRQQIRENKYCYKGPAFLKTGYELARVSTDLEKRLHEVTLPFLVLHGEDDKVIDKNVSQQLYKVAASQDKTLKLYPGMWHSLLYGEPQDNIDIVFKDIISWLDKRCSKANSTL
ncbi:caffeoylshikimate esterase-like [Mangifera indica]|uniref:caffeoylshikimate esterase-like n=1 Tax=Mangifera indica TaxID=29780 RepID=UPI001CF94953|nr:caffeoylshikimate esterase-like [Mangifera indica]